MTLLLADLQARVAISRPVLTQEDVAASERAVEYGFAHSTKNTLKGVLFWLFENATQTWRRVPDRERSWFLIRAIWPEIERPSEDCRAIEQQISNEQEIDEVRNAILATGVMPWQLYRDTALRIIANPAELDRAEIAYKWLRFVRTKNPKRDKLAFLARAEFGSRAAARELGGNATDFAVSSMKDRVLAQIASGLQKSGVVK